MGIAALLLLAPAMAIGAGKGASRPPAVSFSVDQLSSFTPADADPRLAAKFAGRASSITDFSFTPAAAKGRPSQIRVAVRARVSGPGVARPASVPAPSANPLTPTSYNLGVAVGWKRFAVGGDVNSTRDPDSAIGTRSSALVGVSYSLRRFSGRVAVGAERGSGTVPALAQPQRYSLDVGGAYDLSMRLAVTGGVRYRIDEQRDNLLSDKRRDSQAVYIGTALKF
ncbi:porin [Sphingomonas sp. ASV193]|uniref:porin n=1 Tax=Sphingomonas sp. ASV193 TaxID=3144405 RepID=UPI0032E86EBF